MLFWKIIPVSSVDHAKHINTLCVYNAEFVVLMQTVHAVINAF
jgi:hypothetical protein